MELDAQFNGKKAKYIYLTLIQEQPESDEWSSLTYLKLTETLVKYLKNKTSTEDFVILNTYINTIHNLSKTAASFIQNPKNYDFVFIEGKKAKRKIETNCVIEYTSSSYLRDLQLETLLQKWFYSNLITSINNMNDDPLEILRSNIGETRGNALLDFFFEEIKIDNINYNPILQFQGKSVKLAIVVPEKDKSNKKLSQADIKVIKDKRRIKYAEKLSQSPMFCDIFEINKNDHLAIFSYISIPKTADGFISINLNTKDKYWQFDDDPQNYIIDMIKKARTIFQQIND
jgi:hypothetical protein